MANKILQNIIFITLMLTANSLWAEIGDAPSGPYTLDKNHGYISISYTHLGFSNPQIGFRDFDVALQLDSANPANSKLDVTVNAASVDSRVEVFNGHLKGENFFDVENHPTITFNATSIKATRGENFEVTGDLTMKGITKAVTLNATINKADLHPMRKVSYIGVSASGILKRSDWGMGRGAPAVTDEVTLTISVELSAPAPAEGSGMGMGGMGKGAGG